MFISRVVLDPLRNSMLTSFESRKTFPSKVFVLSKQTKGCLSALWCQMLLMGGAAAELGCRRLLLRVRFRTEAGRFNSLIPFPVAEVCMSVADASLCKGLTGCC